MTEPLIETTVTDAAEQSAADAAPSPFTMVTGDPSAMVCEGDVCFVPGAVPVE